MDGLVDTIFKAGVVGCGGAGFPTHVKLARPARWYIVNGVECEPLLRTDRHIMLRHAAELVAAADAVAGHLGAERYGFALKHSYTAEIAALEKAVRDAASRAEIFPLDHFYPAGDEQMVVHGVTGLVVPPGGIPLDVGAVVSNAATLLAVHDALAGRPLTHKFLTVTGAVARPTVLRAPIGTPLTACLEAAGGAVTPDARVIEGGPLMGRPLAPADLPAAVVRKTTSGLVVVPTDSLLARLPEIGVPHTVNRARAACIQCSFCTMLCPRYLLGHPLEPHRVMRALAQSGDIDAMDGPEARQALLCCECGVCELYACPMGLQPRRVNVLLKRKFAAAGIRPQSSVRPEAAREELAWRKVPTARIAARAGVGEYYGLQVGDAAEVRPGRIELPLHQHIGAPAVPVVRIGERVTAGQLVAACPEGALGANIHTGIAGTITRVGDRITVEAAEGNGT